MSDEVDYEDSEEDGCCPICGDNCEDGPCAHLLAVFDLTFPGQGDLGAGLGGGELYGVAELQSLLAHVQHTCASIVFNNSKAQKLKVSGLGGLLADYVEQLLSVDTAGYESLEDFQIDIVANVDDHGYLIRELVIAVLDLDDIGFHTTTQVIDSMPGMSSEDESWWCKDPGAAASAVRKQAKTLLNAFMRAVA